jgi:hypothetical protein
MPMAISKKAASKASKVLRDRKSTNAARTAAASDLAQTPKRQAKRKK